jgi:hypothetical protein
VHGSDPFSLKLMIWLSETNILKNVTVVCASERNDAEVRERFASLVQSPLLTNDEASIPSELTYPTAVFDDNRIISGAEKIINCIVCDGYLQRMRSPLSDAAGDNCDTVIDWEQLTLFNFYSCGLLPEIGNMIVEHREGDNKSDECVKLHEENIHLQVYMNAGTIQHFREEQTLRHEVVRLTDANERLMRIVCEAESELSAEKSKNAKDRSSLVSDKTRLLGDLRDADKRLLQLQKDWHSEKEMLAAITNSCMSALYAIKNALMEGKFLDMDEPPSQSVATREKTGGSKEQQDRKERDKAATSPMQDVKHSEIANAKAGQESSDQKQKQNASVNGGEAEKSESQAAAGSGTHISAEGTKVHEPAETRQGSEMSSAVICESVQSASKELVDLIRFEDTPCHQPPPLFFIGLLAIHEYSNPI